VRGIAGDGITLAVFDDLTEDAMLLSGDFVTGPWRYERLETASH
jgi:hypothetical protein